MDTCIKFKVGLVVSLIEKSIALVIYFSYCNKNCNITSTKQLYLSQRDGVSFAFLRNSLFTCLLKIVTNL